MDGLPSSVPARQLGAAVQQPDVQIKRELVSLYGGEHGASIPSRGYLSDVIWGEQIVYPAETVGNRSAAVMSGNALSSAERIIYYGFNIGQWKWRLDSETTVLTRAFMTQPLLVFLQDVDKVKIAGQMVNSPFFAQALAEHKKYVLDPLWTNNTVLDDLLEGLGEYGVSQLTEVQKLGGAQAFNTRLAQPEITAALQSTQPGINFADKSKTFEIFKGMSVSGSREITTQKEQMDFTSYSTLTYGVQEVVNFENISGGFWDNVDRHFFKVPLLKPVTGWLDKDLVKKTTLGISKIPVLQTVGGSAQVALFRNNPYTPYDAPMAMNLVTAAAVTAEVVGTAAAVFKPELINTLMTEVKAFSDKAQPYVEWTALIYSVAKSGQDLLCTAADAKEGICGDYFKKIDKLMKLVPSGVIDSVQGALKAGEASKPFDENTFCGTAILAGRFTGNVRKTPMDKRSNNTKLAVCAFNELITKPIISNIKDYLPTTYGRIKDVKSIKLTADFFKRAGWKINVTGVPADIRLESLVAQLATTKVGIKDSLKVLSGVMDVSNGTLEFTRAVMDGKVQMLPLLIQLRDALMDYLEENGNAYASAALYDVFKALTPAKYVQLAYAAGNKGTALAWDWMTDPSVVKLAMRRRTKNALDISYQIPEMRAVRYLKVPFNDKKMVSHTLTGTYYRGKDDSYIYPVANDKGSNNLLVMPGFSASIENQSVFDVVDKGTIKQLLAKGNVNLLLDVIKFNSSSEVRDVPSTERKQGDYRYFTTTVQDSFFPWWNPIVGLDAQDVLNQKIFGKDMSKYQAIDFTEIYLNQLKGKANFTLRHKTSGIYSDYTHIAFKSGANEKLFANTFSVYVLNNLKAWATSLNKSSLVYREQKSGSFTGVGEVQLKFNKDVTWSGVGNNGLWAVWHTVQNGKYVWSDPVSLGSILGGETKVLAFPPGIDVKTSELVVYDDILSGYLARSKVSRSQVLNNLVSATYYSQYPLIRVPLPSLASTNSSLLKPIDTDKDGVPDYLDAFKSDPKWAYDTDKDGMPDGWEIQYGLNIYGPADAVKDKDGDGYSNLYEFKSNTSPADKNSKPVPVIAKIVPLTGKVGQTVTLNVSGSNLPSTIVANIAKQTVGCSTATKSATAATFTCPLSVVGSQTLAVKTNTQANGGTVISGGTATFVVSPALTAPKNLKTIPGTSKVTLSWDAVTGAVGYGICRATVSITDVGKCASYAGGAWTGATNTQTELSGLVNGTKYYFRVIALDAKGNKSSASAEVTATPQKIVGVTSKLNDTGITTCSNSTQNGQPCPLLTHPRQDADHGRDVTHNDNSDGHAGFSFTKIGANGETLPNSATDWYCVKDNVTGLIWEIKQGTPNNVKGDSGLHDPDDTFTWYEPDNTKNGGNAGDPAGIPGSINVNYGKTCYGHDHKTVATWCNTKAYVDRVNTDGLCGAKDWRLPSKEELLSIVSYDRDNPAIDTDWFPDTPSESPALFWSISSYAYYYFDYYAWRVDFGGGGASSYFKSSGSRVRLVRSLQ
ncbi:Lcl domain-containing protein [Candidatus Thiothrix anitrata]|uniref:DUF1566 domain-containing protein n=1 Tax=Candidatus Thiothrix anitrata TaxID=2823902 RepID=A0ABX7WYQ1_9GAMM|nr:DUF1566 domain-containing protein [Candidatus Thiothrix anitrata]QTR48864.1 DUF1566 domain-containing protein [Candidatus Thiothrix anitrata]